MFTRKELHHVFLSGLIIITLTLLSWVQAKAEPYISSISGRVSGGEIITITGSDFGANGPTIIVFDDFESGINGEIVRTGSDSAAIGGWDRVGGGDNSNPPRYSNAYSVSGNMAFRGDYTVKTNSGTDSSSAAIVNIDTRQAFLSYWWMLPTTSESPGTPGDRNWKTAWLFGRNANDDDVIIYEMLGGMNGTKDISCNDCFTYGSWPDRSNYHERRHPTDKGKWYRIHAWFDATYDYSGRKDMWTMSTDHGESVTHRWDWSGRTFKEAGDKFEHFVINPWARWCNGCSESFGFFDDVYLAIGPYARARVEIGNAPTYNKCTNLAISTVTSWRNDSITVTVREGSFDTFSGTYLYVFDADGLANTNGYAICPSCPDPPTNVRVILD